MKNSIETIGNRTRDLPFCGAVSQQTAPLRAPINNSYILKVSENCKHVRTVLTVNMMYKKSLRLNQCRMIRTQKG